MAAALEYVGGESGVIMIVGLLVFSFFIIRHMNSGKFTLLWKASPR